MKSTYMPINGRINKENIVHITIEYHAVIKKYPVLYRNMDGAGGHYP